jgi:CIC family chloride channel protein
LLNKVGIEDLVIVKDLMGEVQVTVQSGENLRTALVKFSLQDVDTLPVVDQDDPKKLVGVLRKGDLVSMYDRKLFDRNLTTRESTASR